MAERTTPWLLDPRIERDACGVGFVVDVKGERSHAILEKGLTVLQNLTHRGACGCDPLTGDGAGILVQVPDAFLRRECAAERITLPAPGRYGVGMVFLPRETAEQQACVRLVERVIGEEGQTLLGWRHVPVDENAPGPLARSVLPQVRQVFVGAGREPGGPHDGKAADAGDDRNQRPDGAELQRDRHQRPVRPVGHRRGRQRWRLLRLLGLGPSRRVQRRPGRRLRPRHQLQRPAGDAEGLVRSRRRHPGAAG